jgi:hypothetical protein
MQPYAIGQPYGMPWAGNHQTPTMVAFNMPSDQRANQPRQPGFQPAGQVGQQVPQQQDVLASAMYLPPVPPFPVPGTQQNQQSVHPALHLAALSGQQVPPHLQGSHQGHLAQQPHVATGHLQNLQAPVYKMPSQQQQQPQHQQQPQQQLHPQQHLSSHALNAGMNHRRTPPPPSDDSPQSCLEAEANGYSHATVNAKLAGNGKKRIPKLQKQDSQIRTVEKVLEASDPPILTFSELNSRLQDGKDETAAVGLHQLVQHMKTMPERFLVEGQHVTLTRFAHRDEVRSKLHMSTPQPVAAS